MKKKARVIAFYLPQFHPIPENDKYWGKGFTEWTNVAKAKPLFRGHYQPHIPADLGFYDLRLPETREEQAKLAREAGIEGFCYWHYWLGNGKELLERPFNEVVDSGKPDFPFCLGWANHTWSTRSWDSHKGSVGGEIIVEQTYPGESDYTVHFNKYLKAFKDSRYIKVDGKLLFVVFAPRHFADFQTFKDCWNRLAKENGLKGFFFVGITNNFSITSVSEDGNKKIDYMYKSEAEMEQIASNLYQDIRDRGYDGVNSRGDIRANVKSSSFLTYYFKRFLMKIGIKTIAKYDYKDIIEHYYSAHDNELDVYPTIIPNFDRSPRAGWRTSNLWYNSTPELFKKHVNKALELIREKDEEHKILFLKSWNEWGEGNHMEPDLKYGHGFIEALRDCIIEE
jgi:hypothetical protein